MTRRAPAATVMTLTAMAAALLVAPATAPVAAAPAPAAELPRCRARDRALAFQLPYYAHAGASFDVVYDVRGGARVRELSVTVDGVESSVAPSEDGRYLLTVSAPARIGRFAISAAWQQTAKAAGDPALCRAGVTASIVAVAPSTTLGSSPAARVDGRWHLRFTPGRGTPGARFAVTWTARPDCDLGACKLSMRAPSGTRIRFAPDARLTTYYARPEQQVACVRVTSRGGRTTRKVLARRGYVVESFEQFTVVRNRRSGGLVKERATRIEGRLINDYRPTAAGRKAGCTPKQYRYAFVGDRRR